MKKLILVLMTAFIGVLMAACGGEELTYEEEVAKELHQEGIYRVNEVISVSKENGILTVVLADEYANCYYGLVDYYCISSSYNTAFIKQVKDLIWKGLVKDVETVKVVAYQTSEESEKDMYGKRTYTKTYTHTIYAKTSVSEVRKITGSVNPKDFVKFEVVQNKDIYTKPY